MRTFSLFFMLSCSTLGFAQGVDVCLSLDSLGNLYYSSETSIGGFQFSHACIDSVGGGAAETAGFSLSSGTSIILGYDPTGSSAIQPAEDERLIQLFGDSITESCLSDFIFSDEIGNELTAGFDCSCEIISYSCSQGAWPSEISWSIEDDMGTEIISGLAGDAGTLCLDLEQCYTVIMLDSYGDGWNGAALTLGEETYELIAGTNGSGDYGNCSTECLDDLVAVTVVGVGEADFGFSILDSAGNAVTMAAGDFNGDVCLNSGNCYSISMSSAGGNGPLTDVTMNVDGVDFTWTGEGEYNHDIPFAYGTGCPVSGCTDDEALNYDPAAVADDGSCEYPCPVEYALVVSEGAWPSEISWSILEADGDVATSGGAPFSGTVCLDPDSCYTVVMNDSFGDGWNGAVLTLGGESYELLAGGEGTGLFGTCNVVCDFDELTVSVANGAGTDFGFSITDSTGASILMGGAEFEGTACIDANNCYDISMSSADGNGPYPDIVLSVGEDAFTWTSTSTWNSNLLYALGSNCPILGCMDSTACNYDPAATLEDFCTFPGDACNDLDSLTLGDTLNVDCLCEGVPAILGCTNWSACNYADSAQADDGSCVYDLDAVLDPTLEDWLIVTYESEAGIALYDAAGITLASDYHAILADSPETDILWSLCDSTLTLGSFSWNASTYLWTGNRFELLDNESAASDSTFIYPASAAGCTDPLAPNFNSAALVDDGSCIFQCDDFLVDVTAGAYPSEVSWLIVDATGTVVASGNAPYNDTACLSSDACYSLILQDSFGDGWNGAVMTITSSVTGLPEEFELLAGDQLTLPLGNCIVECNDEEVPVSVANGSGTDFGFSITDSEGLSVLQGGNDFDGVVCVDLDQCYGVSMSSADGNGPLVGVELNIGDTTFTWDGTTSFTNIIDYAFGSNCPIEGCTDSTACNFNPEADFGSADLCDLPGDLCDDGNPFTVADSLSADCLCEGAPLQLGCTNENACNYNPLALDDDGSCIFPGSACDDGDASTSNDILNEECDCIGEPCTGTFIEVDGSDFPEEVSWTITGCDGTLILDGGMPYSECLPFDLPDSYAINLFDSYGDGWDDGYLSIGNTSYTFEADFFDYSAYTETYTVGECECTGTEETIVVTAGEYPWENSWTITLEDGTVMLSGSGASTVDACLPEAECYVINLYDDFGDGWNGAFLNFQGTSYTIDDGNFQSFTACGGGTECTGIEDLLQVTAGDYPEEVSWVLTDSSGAVLYSGGAPSTSTVCLEYGCYTLTMYDNYGDGANGAAISLLGSSYTFYDGYQESWEVCNSTLGGCMYEAASNYNPDATEDNGTCEFGATGGPELCGPNTLWDDVLGMCVENNSCPTDLNGDNSTTTSDLLIFLGAFGTDCDEDPE